MDNKYKSEIRIDKWRLDIEWERQPDLIDKYSKLLNQAQAMLEFRKERLERISDRLDTEIRCNPRKYGLKKTTEAAIRITIRQQSRYTIAQRRIRDALNDVNEYKRALKALDTKKKSLDRLTDLYLANYYSDYKPKRKIDRLREKGTRKHLKGKVKKRV